MSPIFHPATASKSCIVILLLLCLLLFRQEIALAQTYTPPSQVTVRMYVLTNAGDTLPGSPQCSVQSLLYGCTANPSKPYPFSNSTPTVEIDGPVTNTNYAPSQRYLWDVVAAEYGIHLGSQGIKPLSGIKAQAIASRTYVFQRIGANYPINNSNDFHVFVPYSYEVLLTQQSQQARLIQAMQERQYLSLPTNADPIEALYGSDNMTYTTPGNQTYLMSIADPISAQYGCWNGTTNDPNICGTSYGGMSSKGASRWSFGHTSSRGPVALGNPLYPADVNGLGEFWTVKADSAEQILTHYYAGIHVRNTANVNTVSTPFYRWMPLSIDIPKFACLNQDSFWVTFVFQNTGIQNWDYGNTERLQTTVTYLGSGRTVETEAHATVPSEIHATVSPGWHVQLPFPFDTSRFINGQGKYRIRFDMYRNNQSFTSLAAAEQPAKLWYPFDVEIQVYNNCKYSYLPTIQRSAVVNQ